MVWWIALGADDEQYKEELLREGVSWVGDSGKGSTAPSLEASILWWLALFIERGTGPLPKY